MNKNSMSASMFLGRYAGIRVQVHWTFWLLILFVIFLVLSSGGSSSEVLWSTGFVLALFICVVLHEFGHALTAKSYGIDTRDITLLPIGGVARLQEMPQDPKAEFLVAVAGPAVNVVIAFLLYLVLPIEHYMDQSPEVLQEELSMISGDNFLFYLFSANVALVLFNMLPAFPLDGGRVARALLSLKMNRVQATRIAAGMGKFLAAFLFLLGLFYNFILALIAVFIYFGAESERIMVMQMSLLDSYSVRDAMITTYTVIHPGDTLDDVVDLVIQGTERDFVVTSGGNVEGILYMSDLVQSVQEGQQQSVKEVMSQDPVLLTPDESLANVYRKLQESGKNFFPVIDDGHLVGVIDRNNMDEFMRLRASLETGRIVSENVKT